MAEAPRRPPGRPGPVSDIERFLMEVERLRKKAANDRPVDEVEVVDQVEVVRPTPPPPQRPVVRARPRPVEAPEVAPHSRRLEVFGTEGAFVIPHLGSGHLANKNVQPVELYRRGQAAWQTLNLTARTLQIYDLREFAQVVAGKKRPDFSMEHDLAVQETLLRASGMLGAKR